MWRVIVHVRRDGEAIGHDLEVPAEVPSAQLAEMVSKALGWNNQNSGKRQWTIEVDVLGRKLEPHESLAEANVWDGTGLVFKTKKQTAFFKSDTGRKYLLNLPEMLIGRSTRKTAHSSQALVDLKDEQPHGETVSREHARLRLKHGTWEIVFKKVENLTLLNNKAVQAEHPYSLAAGDKVQLGGVKLYFSHNA